MDPIQWRRHALANHVQTLLLLLLMGGFSALLGWLLWGPDGIVSVVTSVALLLVLNPAINPRLLMRMYGARRLTAAEAPDLLELVARLARRAGLPRPPELWYIPSRMINAFSAGRREDAVVALSDGLLRVLDPREQAAVLAHEISHIRADDTWVMGVADLFSRLTGLLALFGQMLLLINLPLMALSGVTINWWAILLLMAAPLVSALAQLGLSRTREYDADLNAARLTGDPQALASALVKIDRYSGAFVEQILFPGKGLPEPSWLRTHPRTEERVARLLGLDLHSVSTPLEEGAPFVPDRRPPAPRWHLHGFWY